MTAPLILGFDTSGGYISAALFDGDDVVSAAYEDMARGQAERLMPLLHEVLAKADAVWGDLTAIGVGVGPGNFTGIRLSVAAARGLALSLKVPAVGISLLEAVALGRTEPVLACLSAPRGSTYLMAHRMQADIPPGLMPVADIPAKWMQPGLTCIGSAAADVAEQLGAAELPAAYAPGAAVARLAAERWQDNPPRPAPLYLKPADAAPSSDQPPKLLDD